MVFAPIDNDLAIHGTWSLIAIYPGSPTHDGADFSSFDQLCLETSARSSLTYLATGSSSPNALYQPPRSKSNLYATMGIVDKLVHNDAVKQDPKEIYGWRVYLLACSACFGGMLFGVDSGIIGGVLTLDSFKEYGIPQALIFASIV